MRWKAIAVLLTYVLIYLLVGAGVFHALEYEKTTPTDITTLPAYTDFQAKYPTVTATDLAAFSSSVAEAYSNGGVIGNATEEHNGWTYENTFYFCVTVISTIGYGHISPTTDGGKVFCIFYALLGIPVLAALLAGIGEKLRVPVTKLHKAKPWCRSSPEKDRWIKSAVVFLSGLAFMLLVPAAVFTHTEEWDYLSSVYYATISLTTVGFGDYVAGGNSLSTAWHKFLMSVWLLIGLAFLAMIVSEASELYIRLTSEKVSKKDDVNNDSETEKGKDGVNVEDLELDEETANKKP